MAQRFRLAKVLVVRRIVEARRQQELAAAERARVREQAVLERLLERAADRREGICGPDSQPLDARRVLAERRYFERLNDAIGAQGEVVRAAEGRSAERRTALVRAMQERMAIENLEARAAEDQRRHADAREQAAVDEAARQGFLRADDHDPARARPGSNGEERS